jgi:hypothetical protein
MQNIQEEINRMFQKIGKLQAIIGIWPGQLGLAFTQTFLF